MESAHLTHAHDHARTAATATLTNSVLTAGQEHDKAARAFHDAAQDTHNAEALRILSLLEDHHRKLAGLIKEAPRKEKKTTTTTTTTDATRQTDSTNSTQSKTSTRTSSAASTTLPPTSRRRLPQSSIATNLAEKRGIPSAKRTTSGTSVSLAGATAGRSEQQSTPVRDLLAQQSRKNESGNVHDAPKPKGASPQPAAPPAEDNFRRFYAAFGGVISAISAPLAFTSLPLNPSTPTPVSEPPKEEKVAKAKSRAQSPEASRTVKSSVPDLTALISKPALRALREDGAPPLGPNESFYLVPTSGGTVTYASVLNAQNGTPATQLNPIDEGSGSMRGSSHEEFVDARESVGPPSPIISRRPRSRGGSTTSTAVTPARSIAAGRGTGLKTMEELALENETLKSVIDKQAKRIQMWELNSQNSFNALAQSFRGARGPPGRSTSDTNALAQALASQGIHTLTALPSPPLPHQQPSSPGGTATATTNAAAVAPPPTYIPTPDADAAKRIADLEAMLASQNAKVNDLMSNNEQLAKQNERNAQVLGRYREQWEKLKAGARKKEQERRERKGGEGAGNANASGKAGEDVRASQTGENVVEGEDELEEEPGFGKA